MSAGTLKTRISGVVILACLAALLSACYALDGAAVFHDRRMGSEGPEVVIAIDQKSAFLAYVMRQQIPSDAQLKRVSVGDTLPDSDVRYYDIPLRYGAPFYRWSVIGEEVVIADPTTGRVIQVVEQRLGQGALG